MTPRQEGWVWLIGATALFAGLFILPALVTVAPDDRAGDGLATVAEGFGCLDPDARRVLARAYRPVEGPFGRWRATDRLTCRHINAAMEQALALHARADRLTAQNATLNRENRRAREAFFAAKDSEESARLAADLAQTSEQTALKRGAELSAFIETLQNRLEDQERSLAQGSETLRAEIASNAELRAELTELTQRLSQQEQELFADRITLSTQSQELDQLHKIRLSLNTHVAALRDQLAHAQTQIQTQASTASTQATEIAALRTEIRDLEMNLGEAWETLIDRDAEFEATRLSLNSTRDRLLATESELFDRRAALDSLQTELQTAQQERTTLTLERDHYLSELGLFRSVAATLVSWDDTIQRLDAQDAFAAQGATLLISTPLFDPGSADLRPEAQTTVQTLASALLALETQLPEHLTWAFLVRASGEGTARTAGRSPSPWALSAARAGALVRALIQNGVAANHLQAAGQQALAPLEADPSTQQVRVDFQTPIHDLLPKAPVALKEGPLHGSAHLNPSPALEEGGQTGEGQYTLDPEPLQRTGR